MPYSELIKNFERIRNYMREFFVYGFKSREEFDKKSGRSYDNERRRIESWLGEYMFFRYTPSGKNIYLSIDSRNTKQNPFYKAFKSKSFTDGDITLHFILLDILHDPEVCLSLKEITELIDQEYLSCFSEPVFFDESTVRKKLKEYSELGLITIKKSGRKIVYCRSRGFDYSDWSDAINFFSEAGLCGVIGSYLLDKYEKYHDHFSFKHHYITHALESEVLYNLFAAMSEKRRVTIKNYVRISDEEKSWDVVPLRIFISVQTGRRYLMGYNTQINSIMSYRLDYITKVQFGEKAENFDELRKRLAEIQKYMWGTTCRSKITHMEHVEFTVHIGDGEEYILSCLEREKRCGKVECIDKNTAKFTADVFDTWELVPWIRTFICRIKKINFSNRSVENQFKKDLEDMYRMYGIEGEVKVDFS